MCILDATLDEIAKTKDISALHVIELYLRSYFSVVLLSNGDVGSAGNYDVQGNVAGVPSYEPLALEKHLSSKTTRDPLLLDYLKVRDRPFKDSLYVSIISALSQSLLCPTHLADHQLKMESTEDWGSVLRDIIKAGDTVSLIGFGGGITVFLQSPIRRLYISDLAFKNHDFLMFAMRKTRERVHRYKFGGEVIFSDGASNRDSIEDSDLAFITGSALCNKTMDHLLCYGRSCRDIVIQGPSASIFPVEFFRRNATHVFTTIKTTDELDVGKLYGGEILKVVDKHYVHIQRY